MVERMVERMGERMGERMEKINMRRCSARKKVENASEQRCGVVKHDKLRKLIEFSIKMKVNNLGKTCETCGTRTTMVKVTVFFVRVFFSPFQVFLGIIF